MMFVAKTKCFFCCSGSKFFGDIESIVDECDLQKYFQNIVADEWHKYFVKARFMELNNMSKKYTTTLPFIERKKLLFGTHVLKNDGDKWIEENIDPKYHIFTFKSPTDITVSPTKEFKNAIKKQKIEIEIEKLQATYPYLYLGKRVNIFSSEHQNTKKLKI